MTPFDTAWAIIKAPITEDEAFRIFDAHRSEQPWNWAGEDHDFDAIMPQIIMAQVNEPSNLAPFFPFTGQTLYRAGDPSGRFFSPQLLTAQQYAGWRKGGFGGNTRDVHSFTLPEVDPDRVYVPPFADEHDGGKSIFPEKDDIMGQRAYALYFGAIDQDEDARFFRDQGKDWVVIPEYASQYSYPPSAAMMMQRTRLRDPELRRRVLSDLGATNIDRGYTGPPQQWGLFYAGGEEGRPILTGQQHNIDPQTWDLTFGRGTFKR